MSQIVKAKLIKRMTADGLTELHDHIPLGKEYNVDLSTRHLSAGINFVKGKRWVREIINTIGDDVGWLPTELLEIDDV
jgi:hypothetical protein